MADAPRLSGRLLLADKPWHPSASFLSSGHRDGPVAMIGTTDADGRFVFHGAPPGRVHVCFVRSFAQFRNGRRREDVQTSGQPLDLANNTVDPGDVVFSFTADDEAGFKAGARCPDRPGPIRNDRQRRRPAAASRRGKSRNRRATNVPAGKFTAVIYPGTYKLSAPFERKAGAAEPV